MFSQRGVSVTNQQEPFTDISMENQELYSCHVFSKLAIKSTRKNFIAVLYSLFQQNKSEYKEKFFKKLGDMRSQSWSYFSSYFFRSAKLKGFS